MIRLDHDTEIMFLDDERRIIHQYIEKNTRPSANSWKFKKPVPIGNGLYCISGDSKSQSFCVTINGERFMGPIRIFSMADDGLITDFPYTKDEFLEMYPELKSKQTDSYPKFQLKGRCNSAFVPMACTDEQIANWKKMLDKCFTDYNVHEIVFTHRYWTYNQLKKRLGMGTDAIRDIVDECIEMYGCF